VRLPVLAAAALALASCQRAPPEEWKPAPPPSAASAEPSAAPVDHLAPGELVEGTQRAFGLAMPREVPIDREQPGSVRAIGPVSVHSLVKYFKPRLIESHLNEGDTFAVFEQVKLSGKPGSVYRIRMTELPPKGTLVELDDVTPPPVPDLPDEAARWRQVGLTPEGKVLDPTRL
jgi:hypothetical protein